MIRRHIMRENTLRNRRLALRNKFRESDNRYKYPGISMIDFLKIDMSRYGKFTIYFNDENQGTGYNFLDLETFEDCTIYKIDFKKDEVVLYLEGREY